MAERFNYKWRVTYFPADGGLRLPEDMEAEGRDVLAAVADAAKKLLRVGVGIADIISVERTDIHD